MNKILAILAILAFSQAQASQPIAYGVEGLGGSLSRIMTDNNRDTQSHLVLAQCIKSGIAIFNSLGKDGAITVDLLYKK